MALPQLAQIFSPYFSNGIATNQLQQIFFSSYFSNAIATNPFHNFFFFGWEMIYAQYFYNKS